MSLRVYSEMGRVVVDEPEADKGKECYFALRHSTARQLALDLLEECQLFDLAKAHDQSLPLHDYGRPHPDYYIRAIAIASLRSLDPKSPCNPSAGGVTWET